MRPSIIALIVFSLLLLSTGCPDPFADTYPDGTIDVPETDDPSTTIPSERSGAMLVSHGNYLYRIGGLDDDGKASTKTYVASIEGVTDDEIEWTETTPLPEGRAFASAFAVGNLLYVVGGYDGTVSTSTIFYTSISSSDGTLGFSGAPRFWERNPNGLPHTVSHASHVLHDGRIFLVGGTTDEGISDSIIHARIWPKGPIGKWYQSPEKLPSARQSTGSTVWIEDSQPYLVVAGGIDTVGTVLDKILLYTIGGSGLLSPVETSRNLPESKASPVVFSNTSHLLVTGGYDAELQASTSTYQTDSFDNDWTPSTTGIYAEGPTYGRGAGRIWLLHQEETVPLEVASWQPIDYVPSIPTIGPGSGIIQSNTKISIHSEAGSTVSFMEEGGTWQDVSHLETVTENQSLAFKATYTKNGVDSAIATRHYRVRSLEFTEHISGSLNIEPQANGLKPIYLTEDICDSTATAKNRIWVQFRIFDQKNIQIHWEDSSSHDSSPYTAHAKLSLFEEDLLTETIDNLGNPIIDVLATSPQPIEATLQSGTYYFLFEEMEGNAGSSIGILISQEE